MIDINYLVKKLQMQAVIERIAEHDMAHELSKGVWIPEDDFILPEPLNTSRKEAWKRAKRQVQSLGPRILRSKKQAVLGGGITWGDTDDKTDEFLVNLNLERLANGLLENLVIDGMAAAMAHQDEETGEFTITRLGGYMQPYLKPNDIDVVTGIYQAWSSNNTSKIITSESEGKRSEHRYESTRAGQTTYSVRIYDFVEETIKQWDDLRRPTDLALNFKLIENAPVPRFAISEKLDEGLALGEMLQAMPVLIHHYTLQLLKALSTEMSVFSMFYTKGDVEITEVGPAQLIAMEEGADAGWIKAEGNLEELNKNLIIVEERLRSDLSLSGGFLGNDSPSGEALQEANIKFRQNTEYYAKTISDILTKCVHDLSELTNDVKPVQIVVQPSKDFEEKTRRDTVLMLYKEGLLPLDVAAIEIQRFFPTWSDEALNEWVESQTATVNVEDFDALAGEITDTGNA